MTISFVPPAEARLQCSVCGVPIDVLSDPEADGADASALVGACGHRSVFRDAFGRNYVTVVAEAYRPLGA